MQDHLAQGLSAAEARKLVLQSFGNRTLIRERARDSWRFILLENIAHDFVYAMRGLRRDPAFAVAAIAILALGIGGTTAMFSVIRGVLLKPLGYREPDRLVRLSIANPQQSYRDMGFSQVRYRQLKEHSHSFSEVGAFFIATEHFSLTGGAVPDEVNTARVSANFLQVLGVRPLRGRSFLPEEDRPGGTPVALISSQLWKRRFHADPRITGTAIDLNATPYTIVGVLPDAFEFPAATIDIWVTKPSEYSAIAARYWNQIPVLIGVARLKPGVALSQARAEMLVLDHEYARLHPEESHSVLQTQPLREHLVANVRSMLWVLFGAVGCVLLIACANVASLLLSRASARTHEMTVKAALGAGRGRLIRQLLVESTLLSLLGSGFGIVLAKWSLSFLLRSSLLDLPRAGEVHLDGIVLTLAVLLSVVTGVVFGLFPALQVSRPHLTDVLQERRANIAHSPVRKSWMGFSVRSLLVAGQIALSVVLLIGAALLAKSFLHLRKVDPGLRPANLLTLEINLPPKRYDTPEKKNAFFQEVIRRVESLSGVRSVTASLTLPGSPKYVTGVQIVGQPATAVSKRPPVQLQSITPGYLKRLAWRCGAAESSRLAITRLPAGWWRL